MNRNRIVICLIILFFISSCYLLPNLNHKSEDLISKTIDASVVQTPVPSPTNIVIYLTETIPSVTPTPIDVLESVIDYTSIPDGYSLIYFNYNDNSLYLLPEDQDENRKKIIGSGGDINANGKELTLFSENGLTVFNLLDKSKVEYQIDKDYCRGLSWFPSGERLIIRCEYSLYLFDIHEKRFIDFIIAEEYIDAFLHPLVSPNGKMISYGYDSLSKLYQEPDEGLYISDIDCVESNTSCRDEAKGPFLSYAEASNFIQAWSPSSKYLSVYSNHKIWIIDVSSGQERLLIDELEYIDGLAWHPRGNWIMFSQAGQIYKVPFDGGESTLVAENTGYLEGWIHKTKE